MYHNIKFIKECVEKMFQKFKSDKVDITMDDIQPNIIISNQYITGYSNEMKQYSINDFLNKNITCLKQKKNKNKLFILSPTKYKNTIIKLIDTLHELELEGYILIYYYTSDLRAYKSQQKWLPKRQYSKYCRGITLQMNNWKKQNTKWIPTVIYYLQKYYKRKC